MVFFQPACDLHTFINWNESMFGLLTVSKGKEKYQDNENINMRKNFSLMWAFK